LPGWQRFYEQHRAKAFEIVAVAVDVQGADRAKPWAEKAGAKFTTLVDQEAKLGAMFGLNYVPFSILIDEQGKIVRAPQHVSVAKDTHRATIAEWIEKGDEHLQKPASSLPRDAPAFADVEAELRFARAALLLRRGQTANATAELKRALARDPDNWLIRKQIWALEHPDRFYDGPVDFGWQRAQLQKEADSARGDGR